MINSRALPRTGHNRIRTNEPMGYIINHESVAQILSRPSADAVASRPPLGATAKQRLARRDLLRQVSLEWCELEDLTEFLDSQLAPLELAIDNFRGEQEMSSKAHTPHIRDIGRLMFRI